MTCTSLLRSALPLWLAFSTAVTVGCGVSPSENPTDIPTPPPETRRDNVVDVLHGEEIVDPYRWLEDQQAAETRQWIGAQNRYTTAHLADRPERQSISRRLEELMRVDRVGTPIERQGRFFVWRKKADDDLWILYLRQGLDGEDEVLIDPHSLSEDHTTSVSLGDISDDGKLLIYQIRVGGVDETEPRIMDVETKTDLADRLPTALYSGLVMKPDHSGFYYGRQDRKTGYRVFYHALGTDAADDVEIFGDGYGPGQWITVDLSASGRYLLLRVEHGWSRSELFVQDLEQGGPAIALAPGIEASFSPAFAGDRLFVQTDWQAPKGRILEVNLADPDPTPWREVVPEGEDTIRGYSLVAGRLFVHTMHNVASRIQTYDLEGASLGALVLPSLGSASTPAGNWQSHSAFYSFESYTSPSALYRFDAQSSTHELWNRAAVPFDGSDFTTSQHWYPSKDGTKIPMFVVHKKNLEKTGDLPTLLYGYGGFNVSLTPRFRTLAALWIENGGVFALANLRGGGEFGDAWHRAGMLGNKQNVFDDFIAAAEWLVDSGYTRPERLAIQGRSNGGLLVGTVLTQRPDLFRAVLCEFPDLDMVRYYQFENNNPPALLEYGDASNPEHFQFLKAYSPYQNVKDGTPYPAVMLTTGDADTRVPPLQARKMAARLQAATSSERPVFLLYDTKAGHAGGRPLSKVIDDLSLEAAFLFSQVGLQVTEK